MVRSFKILSQHRLKAAPNRALLSPVKDLTLSTLDSIAIDPKDPRQQQAQREAERRRQQYEQSQAPKRAREQADKAREQAAENREKAIKRQQQQKDKNNKVKPAGRNRSGVSLDVMKSPIAQ